MQKNLTSYCEVIDEKLFQFMCEPHAPTLHAKEFLFRVIKWIGDIEAYHQDQAAQQKAQLEEADLSVTDEVKHEDAA